MYKIKDFADKIKTLSNKDEVWDKWNDKLQHHFNDFKEHHPDKYENTMECLYALAYGKSLSEHMAYKWVDSMKMPNGQLAGEHWSLDQTNRLAKDLGITFNKFNQWEFYAIIHALYSDECDIAKKYNLLEDTNYWGEKAKAWLTDNDVAEGKAYNYYTQVVK